MNYITAFFWDWIGYKIEESRHYHRFHPEVIMTDAHFHPVHVGDLDHTADYPWQICPDCQLVYYIPSGSPHACILPHMDALVPAAPVIDPQPRLCAASFCRSCGFVVTSPESDLIHSQNCANINLHGLYIGDKLCPTEDQSGPA